MRIPKDVDYAQSQLADEKRCGIDNLAGRRSGVLIHSLDRYELVISRVLRPLGTMALLVFGLANTR